MKWLVLALVAIAAAFTAYLDRLTWHALTPPLRPPLEPLPNIGALSSQRCAACHPDIAREWSESRHAAAFSDPLYQADLELQDRPYFCEHCHAPLNEQQPRPATGVLLAWPRLVPLAHGNPRFQPELRHEGVTCVACHQVGDAIAGPYETASSPHPVHAVAGFGDETLCEGCHTLALTQLGDFNRPLMETVTEWREYRARGGNRQCVDCHLPRVEPRSNGVGAPPRAGRDHRLRGPWDADFMATALEVRRADVAADGTLTLAVFNATGHRLPTAEPHRSMELSLELFDDFGSVGRTSTRVERNVDLERLKERSDNTLTPREERTFTLRAAASRKPTRARVTIDFWLWDPQDAVALKAGVGSLSRRLYQKDLPLP